MESEKTRVGREEWAKRVERWQESGLTSKEFAAELGISANTLTYWKWRLRKERVERSGVARSARPTKPRAKRASPRKPVPEPSSGSPLVVMQASPSDSRIEVELGNGRRLRVPSSFDGEALRRLVTALEHCE